MSKADWVKYPRTLHHPSSPGVGHDDKIARDLSAFEGAEVIVTEKMDGENISIYSDGYHARSLDTGYHPSRDWLAAYQAERGYRLPQGHRICGEYLYARHSIAYQNLPSFFLGFSAWDKTNSCLSWDDTLALFADVEISPTPTIYRGKWRDGLVENLAKELNLQQQEGLVVRIAARFSFNEFQRSLVKWVRADHVISDTHWRNAPVVPNGLAEGDRP